MRIFTRFNTCQLSEVHQLFNRLGCLIFSNKYTIMVIKIDNENLISHYNFAKDGTKDKESIFFQCDPEIGELRTQYLACFMPVSISNELTGRAKGRYKHEIEVSDINGCSHTALKIDLGHVLADTAEDKKQNVARNLHPGLIVYPTVYSYYR